MLIAVTVVITTAMMTIMMKLAKMAVAGADPSCAERVKSNYMKLTV